MTGFLEWFQVDHCVPILGLVCILTFLGNAMGSNDVQVQRRSTWFASTAFLLYVALDVWRNGAASPVELLAISLRGLMVFGVAYAVGSIAFSILNVIQTPFERLGAELIRPMARKLAWARYQRRLRLITRAKLTPMEASAAKEKAKHVYLQDIDKAIS
jgi:hypothetical protein